MRSIHVLSLALLLVATGCAPLGESYQRDDLPPGTPDPLAVLVDLARNESAIGQFKATGEFTLKSPDLAGTQALRQSTVYYRHPSELHVVGRKYTSTVLKLSCSGPAFVMEFPTEKEYIHREQGEYVPELETSITPAWIVGELFRPVDWSGISGERVRVAAYDAATQQLTLEILREGEGGGVERRLELTGPPWVLKKNELFAADGQLLAVTTKEDYRLVDELWFPAVVETEFPRTEAYMRISMRKVFLNEPLDAALFDLDAILQHLRTENYQRVEFYEDMSMTP